jgi:RecA/RadA recombinase
MKQIKITKIEKIQGTRKVHDIEVGETGHYLLSDRKISKNSGGGGLKYAASTIIFLSKTKLRDEADKSEVLGSMLTATLDKSRFTKFGTKTQMLLSHASGLDRYWGLFDLGKEEGLLVLGTGLDTKKGQNGIKTYHYLFPDGQIATKREIEANPSQYFEVPANFAAFEELCAKTFRFGKGEVAPPDEIFEEGEEKEVPKKKDIEFDDNKKKKVKKQSDSAFFDKIMSDVGVDIPVASELDETAVTTFYDTGSLLLNAQISGSMNGGMAGNKITALAGEEATGKSFIALQLVRNFLNSNPCGHVFYFDSEDAITEQMMTERGIDSSRVHKKRVKTIQEFRQLGINLIDAYLETESETRPPMMYVLDSLGNLSTTKEMTDIAAGSVNKKGEEVRDMTRPGLIRGLFRVLTIKLGEGNVPMLMTNHTYETMDMYSGPKMCLVTGTEVLGVDGPVSIEKLNVGDRVQTSVGNHEVSAVYEFDVDEVLQITFEDGSVVTCTPDHKFLGSDLQWTRAEDLAKYDSVMVVA